MSRLNVERFLNFGVGGDEEVKQDEEGDRGGKERV